MREIEKLSNIYLGKTETNQPIHEKLELNNDHPADNEHMNHSLNKNIDDDDNEYINTPWQEVLVFPNPDYNGKIEYIDIKDARELRSKCFIVSIPLIIFIIA